jgi:hypothetical protein
VIDQHDEYNVFVGSPKPLSTAILSNSHRVDIYNTSLVTLYIGDSEMIAVCRAPTRTRRHLHKTFVSIRFRDKRFRPFAHIAPGTCVRETWERKKKRTARYATLLFNANRINCHSRHYHTPLP